MKRNHLLALGAAVLLLSSCGPRLHRYSCGGKRRCISQLETQKKQPLLQPKETKRNA